MNDVMAISLGVVLWLALSLVGLLLPIFLGLALFLFVAPIISGYVAGRNKKASSIVIVSLITTVLSGAIGLATIGSVPPELQRSVTASNTLILVWVFLNASLTLITGYARLKSNRQKLRKNISLTNTNSLPLFMVKKVVF